MYDIKTNKKKNSLIELYRFLFAFNVIIGHGLFPIDIPYFGPDRISVEFFFILSGFLFCNSLTKLKNMSLGRAVVDMLHSKLKPLLVPMLIGMLSNAIYNYLTDYKPVIEVFRYLWYIPAMLAIMLVYTVLRVVVKKDDLFRIAVLGVFIISTLLRFSGNEALFYFDYIRSASAVSLGILIAYIPKIKPKFKDIAWAVLLSVALGIFYIVCYRLAKDSIGYEAILDLVLYPVLIYVTFSIDFHFSIFNYLGELSFGLYAFQCTARLIAHLGVPSKWIPFGFIILAAVSEDLIKRIVKFKRGKKI